MKDIANNSSRSSSSMPRKKWSVALLLLFVLTPLVLYSFMFPSPPSDVPLLRVEEVIDEEEPEEEEPLAILPSVPPVSPSLLSPPAGTRDEDAVLLELQRKVKVIVTTVARNRARVELLRRVYHDDPWARDLFVFISDTEEPDLGTITVPKCNAIHSWVSAKCCRFAHFYFSMWEEQYPEVEWVFKADDDSYVHPRNLLLAVASLQRSAGDKPLFLGDRTSWGHGRRDDDPAYADLRSLTIWPHGGAGWLLNRAARDHLKAKPSLSCGGLDDVGFGQWATRHRVPLTPYFGFHQRTAFEGKPYEEGHGDLLGSVKPAAFFLCVKDDVIRLPYYPVTFHKLMATFPQMHAIMQRKRFELLPLPQLRPEDRHLESRGDNYYRRVRPWLEALAANETAYAHTDCRSLFDLEAIWQLKRDLKLP